MVDGIQYKTGLGQNKKESKSNAAKLALDELLQLDETEPKPLENPGTFATMMFFSSLSGSGVGEQCYRRLTQSFILYWGPSAGDTEKSGR